MAKKKLSTESEYPEIGNSPAEEEAKSGTAVQESDDGMETPEERAVEDFSQKLLATDLDMTSFIGESYEPSATEESHVQYPTPDVESAVSEVEEDYTLAEQNPFEPSQLPADEVAPDSPSTEPMAWIETNLASDISEQPPTAENRKTRPGPRAQERQDFYDLDFNELDRDLPEEARQEWNAIYASYRGRSVLTGRIIGVDRHAISVRNRQTGILEEQEMFCAIVVPYRVRIVIPAPEMWDSGQERPDFVLRNMVGASIDFVILKVDRKAGFAIASRRLAARSRRYFFSRRPTLNTPGSRVKCRILSVGPRRCLVECFGHDISLTQRELRYTAIPDLRSEYHPGAELTCVVKAYDSGSGTLAISVKDTKSNPFDGAELRHPTGSRRQAVIAGKYGGGVFCNLPDGTVCMCAYAFQHEDSEFQVGDTVILVIQRYDLAKRQIYGKIIAKW